ncbi:MAG: Jag N-terminal domain-containing protein, partial [Chloroflexota bacterium]|nr:Jag N-terminal domain-containing protein [Chloroflexota bacterium]
MQQRTSVEIQAYSVEEATRLALEELKLTPDDVDIEILSDVGPDEDAEALVRVTAKGMASQPVPRAQQASTSGEQRDRGARPRNRGRNGNGGGNQDWLGGRSSERLRPSLRGAPPQKRAVDRIDSEDEIIARGVVRDLLERMGVTAEAMAVDNPSSVPLDQEE